MAAALRRWDSMLVGAFALALLIAVFAGRISAIVLGVYAAVSLLTFAAYGADKRAAVMRRTRTSEAALHLLALAGGWPGALIAQGTFRHKTVKQPFRTLFWLTVVANCAALWVLAFATRR